MPGHQLFGGATNDGEPGEFLVEGSDLPRTGQILRERMEERAGKARAEEAKLADSSHGERKRVLHFNLTSHLVVCRWPTLLLIRMSLGRRYRSDFMVYPDLGKYSPCCPGFYQNGVSGLEFEGSDEIRPGALWNWCQRHYDDLSILEAFETGAMDRIARML